MKKRILSLLLAILMVISMFPVQIFAEGEKPTEGAELCATCGSVECSCESTSEPTSEPTEETTEETTEATTAPACKTCGEYDCTSDHANWCDKCKKDNCGESHVAQIDDQAPECSCDAAEGAAHATDCALYTCPTCGAAEYHETCPKEEEPTEKPTEKPTEPETEPVTEPETEPVTEPEEEKNPLIGKRVKLDPNGSMFWPYEKDTWTQVILNKDSYPAYMVITDVLTKNGTDYYRLAAAEGYTWPAATQDREDAIYLESTKLTIVEKCDICGEYDCSTEHVKCEHCGEYDCSTEHVKCEHCGEMDCTKLHFYCDICDKYDCGRAHLYCNICEKYDCETTHTFCGTCGEFDCTTQHEDIYKPTSKPSVPSSVTLNPNKDVTVADEDGNAVDAFYLFEGSKSTISAWSELDKKSESYQWQVRYGADLWADIQGQTSKGLLASPAMFRSIIRLEGSAAVRCVIKAGDETVISEEIPVTISEQPAVSMLKLLPRQTPLADEPETNGGDDDNKVNVIVNYIFRDGKIAANSWVANLPANEAYATSTPITVPSIVGYTAIVGEHDAGTVTLSDNKLSLSFTAAELANDCTVNIVYQPAPVKVTVNHHLQNVDDDNYTLKDTEEKLLVTGTTVGDVHKTYEGFYYLLYEHPTVAADGSTVVDVYYDRYYYLMTFDLSGGYGMDAIYARYGTRIPFETMNEPTRPGYTLTGWTLDGNTSAVYANMPARNTTFVAVWASEMTSYDVVFWYENADNEKFAQAGVLEDVEVLSGTIVNGSDYKDHAFTNRDDTHFTYSHADENVEVNGDGSTVVNVYFTRNKYTLTFVMGSTANNCTVPIHASHTDYTGSCYSLACDKYHVHDDTCQKTQTCTTEEHVHTDDCLKCGTAEHAAHTDACYTCTEHTHSAANGCTLNCQHTHTAACYGGTTQTESYIINAYLSSIQKVTHHNGTASTNPESGYVYEVVGISRHYLLYFDSVWYTVGEDNRGTPQSIGSYVGEFYEAQVYKYPAKLMCTHDVHDNNCYECDTPVHVHGYGNCTYKDELHTHSDACYEDTAHTHDDDCYTYQCGVLDHTHTQACYELTCDHLHYHSGNTCYLEITRKYDADISDVWKENPVKAVIDGGDAFTWSETQKQVSFMEKMPGVDSEMNRYDYSGGYVYHWFYYLEVLPGMDTTGLTIRTDTDGKVYYQYDDSTIHSSGLSLTYDDDYYPITGFDQRYEKGEDGWELKQNYGTTYYAKSFTYENASNEYRAYLYYTRNSYNLTFSNYGVTVPDKGGAILYEADISGQNFTPDYPSTLEPGAYEFEGWYTSPFFGDTKFDFTTTDEDGNVIKATMPAEDITLYANWVPVKRTVRFFLDKDDMEAEKIIPTRMAEIYAASHDNATDPNDPYRKFATRTDVPNKSFLEDITTPGVSEGYEKHPYNGYTFVGWFYMEDGVEKAFDPANMPVIHDLDLYGKWSFNVLCPYEIRFVLDADNNGEPDVDENGANIYVADPVTGSTLAGNSRTFNAKGDTALYTGYQEGYYPNIPSHNVEFKPLDEDNDGEQDLQVYTFLYSPSDPVPYTVKYLEKGTNKVLADEKYEENNTKAVVTENFKLINGYMPDAYQKTLVVVPDGTNEIIFWYTEDTEHAFYQVNHYVQTPDGTGWMEYRTASFTGEIEKDYSETAISITGFTFSDELTSQYNTVDKKNMFTGTDLPGPVSLSGNTVSGTLSANGMELNLYYTRNQYTYKVQYLEYGTNEVLSAEKTKTAYYNEYVTEKAVNIEKDMDGDGKFEDFQLYEPTNNPQTATIRDDSTVLTFYYVRCTAEELKITKTVTGNPTDNLSFNFTLTSTATDFGGENVAYTYELDGVKGTAPVVDGAISFSLKAGQTIKFLGLPTAKYTVKELNLPMGYYCNDTEKEVLLTKDASVAVEIINEYSPTKLRITKIVNRVENVADNVENFEFYIEVPEGITGEYIYTVRTATADGTSDETATGETRTAEVVDGKMTITLKDMQDAVFENLPVGTYTVTEQDYTNEGYSAKYTDSNGTGSDGQVELTKGKTEFVSCINAYPVGSLSITKTVQEAYEPDDWTNGTFTFTVTRTDGTLNNSSYPVYNGTEKIGDVTPTNNQLTVNIPFDELGTKTFKIDNLPKGVYQVVEAEDTDGAYIQTSNNADSTNLTVKTSISPEDYAGSAVYTNTYKKHKGDLKITKTVNQVGTAEIPTDAEFKFTISGTAVKVNTEYKVTIGGAESIVKSDGENNLTVTLKAGQTAVIHDLNADYFSWKEEPDARFIQTGATVTNAVVVGGNNHIAPNTDTVSATDATHIQVTNTYVPRGNLQVEKFIDRGNHDYVEINDGQKFEFTLQLSYDLNNAETYAATVYSPDADPVNMTLNLSTDKKLTFELKHNEHIVIEGLPTVNYTLSEKQEEGYLAPVFDGNETGTIPAGETKVVECQNIIQMMPGDLKITKVIKDETDNASAPKNTLFTFTVKLSYLAEVPELIGAGLQNEGCTVQDYVVEYTCDSTKGTLSAAENGEQRYTLNSSTTWYDLPTTVKLESGTDDEYTFTVQLCDGMSATIKNLPASSYHVVETAVEGFGATYDNQTGHIGGAKTDAQIPTAVVNCTNTYPVNLNGVLQIKKQVTKDYQRDVLPADEFTFTVIPTDGNKLEGEYTVKLSKVYTYEQDADDVAITYQVIASDNKLVVRIPFDAAELVMGLNDSRSKLLTIEGLPMGQYDVVEAKDEDYRQEPSTLTHNVPVSSVPGVATFVNRYRRHLGVLEIVKVVEGTNAEDAFLFHISGQGVELDVTINGSGSVKIYDLPMGTYTVTEDTEWSWRYTTGKSTDGATLTLDDYEETVTFTNTYRQDKWLDVSAIMENVFRSNSSN